MEMNLQKSKHRNLSLRNKLQSNNSSFLQQDQQNQSRENNINNRRERNNSRFNQKNQSYDNLVDDDNRQQNFGFSKFKDEQNNINMSCDYITEEGLDDWIAQSLNRPIYKFLDPYKKFNAPQLLVSNFKQRYMKIFKQKDTKELQKEFYFDDSNGQEKISRLYIQDKDDKNQQKNNIIFNYQKLIPKPLPGISISIREQNNINKIKKAENGTGLSFLGISKRDLGETINLDEKTKKLQNSKLINQNDSQSSISSQDNEKSQKRLSKSRESPIRGTSKENTNRNLPQNDLNFSKMINKIDNNDEEWSKQQQKQMIIKIEKLLEEEIEKQIKPYTSDSEKPFSNQEEKLEQHVKEITEIRKPKNEMDNVDITFFRAVRKIKKGAYDAAIPQLKQVLNLNKVHFSTIFNIGCCYERLKKYDLAKKWFEIAIKFPQHIMKENEEDINYGIALCNYKTGNLQTAFEYIDQLAKNFNEKKKDEKKLQYFYLRCLCSKQMKDYVKSGNDYKQFIYFVCPKNYIMIMHLMFAMIFKNLRKNLDIKFDPLTFCEFNTVVKFVINSKEKQEKLYQFYDSKKNSWKIEKQQIVEYLIKLSFFKRFKQHLNTILNLFDDMKLKKFEDKRVLFPRPDEVYIITAGYIAVYDHRQKFNLPDIIAYYSEGDIIGSSEKDNYISQFPDIWFISMTQVEFLVIPRQSFNEIWKLHSTDHEKLHILQLVQKNPLFHQVSDLLIYKISYELFEKVTFQKGNILFNDGECLEKYHYIELKRKDLKTTKNFVGRLNDKFSKFDFYRQQIRGFFIILSGEVELETPTGWLDYNLGPSEYFGENLLFSTVGISRFGRLKAKSDKVECLLLDREKFIKLNQIDKNIMKNNCRKSQYFRQCQQFLYKYYKTQKLGEDQL